VSSVALARLGRQRGGNRQNRRRSRRIVVRAEMNLVDLVLRGEGVAGLAVAEVVEVRADGHPWLRQRRSAGRRRQVADHVVGRPLLALDVRTHGHVHVGDGESRHVRIAGVQGRLRAIECLVRHACKDRVGGVGADAGGHDARTRERRVEAHGHGLAGVRRPRPRDDEHGLRAVLARGHRLVPQVGVARKNAARVLIRVLGEIPQDEHDLVLHVERRVAVVAEVLTLGHHDAVAGEDHRAGDLGVVRERQRPHVGLRVERGRPDGQTGPAILRACGEFEGETEVTPPRQWFRADLPELGHEIVGGQFLPLGTCQAPFEPRRREHLHVRPRSRRRVGGAEAAARCERERGDESKSNGSGCHHFLAAFDGVFRGAFFSASMAFS